MNIVSVVQFFIQHFRELMTNRQSTGKEISMAIRGYGTLAAVSMFLLLKIYLLPFCVLCMTSYSDSTFRLNPQY